MGKLARIARIIVNVGELCENHNLSEEDLPASLRAILRSLQRFVFSVTIVLPGPRELMKDQRAGQDRAGAEEVLEEKWLERVSSTKGFVDEDQEM
jgi:hypothetical protein